MTTSERRARGVPVSLPYMSIDDAAKVLDVSRRTVERYIDAGRIPCYLILGRPALATDDVHDVAALRHRWLSRASA